MSYNVTRLSRQKQISTLHVFNHNVTEIVEGSHFRIRFQSDNLSLALDIRLPANFPESDKPEIECVPPVEHSWVNPITGRVDSPGLRNFSQHSDLGRLVLAIRSELEKAHVQPIVLQHSGSRSQATSSSSSKSLFTSPSTSTNVISNVSSPSFNVVQQNTSMAQPFSNPIRDKIEELSDEDLKEILNNDDGFEKFMLDFKYEPLGVVDDYLTELRDEVKNKCDANLSLQAQVEQKREELISKCQNYHELKRDLMSGYERLKDLREKVSPPVLTEQLVRLSVNCEEESDEIAETFLDQEIPVDEFLSKYISSRQTGHIRKLKADKLRTKYPYK